MLIKLYKDHPQIEYEKFPSCLVVDFAIFKNWTMTPMNGLEVVSQKPWKFGVRYRVTLHRPTVYEFKVVAHKTVSSEIIYCTLMLSQKKKGWNLEVVQNGSKLSLSLKDFNPAAQYPFEEEDGNPTLWSFLDEEV